MSRKQQAAPTDIWKWDRKLSCAIPKPPKPIHMYHFMEQRDLMLAHFEKIKANKQQGKVLSSKQLTRKIRADWNKLSQEEKQVYAKKHEKDKKRYEAQVKEWESKGYFTLQSGISSKKITKSMGADSMRKRRSMTPMPPPKGKRPAPKSKKK